MSWWRRRGDVLDWIGLGVSFKLHDFGSVFFSFFFLLKFGIWDYLGI